MVVIAIIAFAILIFAIYGFIAFLIFLAKAIAGDSSPAKTMQHLPVNRDSLIGRSLATCRQVDQMMKDGQISAEAYAEIRDALESGYLQYVDCPPRVRPRSAPASEPAESATRDQVETIPVTATPPETVSPQVDEAEVISAELVEEVVDVSPPTDTAPTPARHTPPVVPSPSAGTRDASHQSREDVSALTRENRQVAAQPGVMPPTAPPASPFDVPDSVEASPSRTFKEMLSGFMEKRNIRWGELASGILIVGSAVGLVFSLRDELQDRIPYFSALLFLLITAAIHAAGIYTLKKWKLRNTSRGVLIIGLLLIPINFLAACILTGSGLEKRSLTDPLYWTAIGIGLASFGAMSWLGAQSLLRKYSLPLFISVFGVSAWTLAVNRIEPAANAALHAMFLIAPACFIWLVAAWRMIPRQWSRAALGVRIENRLLTILGISLFALANVALLMLLRSPEKLQTLTGMIPACSVVAMTLIGLGGVIHAGGARRIQRSKSELVGTSFTVFGVLVVATGVVASAFHPAITLANACVIGVACVVLVVNRKWSWAAIGAWASFALVLVSISQMIQVGDWSSRLSVTEVFHHWVDGKTGILFVVSGAFALALSWLIGRRSRNGASSDGSISLAMSNRIGGAGLCVAGCLLALLSSFLDPSDLVDANIATALLGVLAIGSLVMAIRSNEDWHPVLACGMLYGFLAHLLFWNVSSSVWLDSWIPSLDGRWMVGFAVAGLLLALTGFYRRALGFDLDHFSYFAIGSIVLAALAAIPSIEQQTGLVAFIGVVTIASWLLIEWDGRMIDSGFKLVFGLQLGVVLIVADCVTRLGWSPSVLHVQHLMIQIGLAAGFGMLWAAFRNWAPKRLLNHLKIGHVPSMIPGETVLQFLTVLALAAVVCVSIFDYAGFEFSRNWSTSLSESRDVVLHHNFVMLITGGVLVCVLVASYLKPSIETLLSIVITWFTAWILVAGCFSDSRSVASALRWLIPTGGVLGMLLFLLFRWGVDGVQRTRQGLRLDVHTVPSAKDVQWTINTALGISVFIVLAVSTITIATVMLAGPDILGGPTKPSWFGDLRKDVSFGVPIAILVATFLVYAVSERRCRLATMGSWVFQYVVVLAVILLALSPNPKLASVWFVNILQTVSLGMSTYGLVWYWNRERIGLGEAAWLSKFRKLSQLDLHTILNLVLIGSLIGVILVRYYMVPTNSAGWITSVGGPLGVASLGLVTLLVVLVWRESLQQVTPWLVGFLGLSLSAFAATVVDRYSEGAAWQAYRMISVGTAITVLAQLAINTYRDTRLWKMAVMDRGEPAWFASAHTQFSIFALGGLCAAFSVRGVFDDSAGFWFQYLSLFVVLLAAIAYSWIYYSRIGAIASLVLTVTCTYLFCDLNPMAWASGEGTQLLVVTLSCLVLAIVWLGYYLIVRNGRHRIPPRHFVCLPNLIVFLAAFVMLILGGLENLFRVFGEELLFDNPWVSAVVAGTIVLYAVQLWNDRARLRIVSRYLWLTGFALLVSSVITDQFARGFEGTEYAGSHRFVNGLLSFGFASLVSAGLWSQRKSLRKLLVAAKVPRLAATQRAAERQLPVILLVMSAGVLLLVWPAIINLEGRVLRYLLAFAPLLMAGSLGLLSLTHVRRSVQMIFLILLVVATVVLGWAGLTPEQMRSGPSEPVARLLMVLAFGVFVLGALIPRWVRHGDRWLTSFRQMTIGLSVLSLLALVLCTGLQWLTFHPEQGSGLSTASIVGAGTMIFGMVVGLITIAIRPQHDPLALPIAGRKGYIYLAQAVVVLLGIHIYLGMPWLLQLGVLRYWPYVALVVSMAGIGVAWQLQKRKLEVLAEPLFNTAALLPLLVSIGFWMVRSEADAALTLLAAGLIYLTVALMHRSILAGAMSLILANVALWTFYQKFPQFAFFEHPQLWLIPPALSVLAASQLLRQRISASQLGMIRYVSSFVIYLSSTGEIFIHGLGTSIWPPMILAVLSLLGMGAGILLQVRSFLYVGVTFLFMSMVAMVSHAHRRLDHVWPWWVFGICVGAMILVGFGLMEKRRNDLSRLGNKLKQWDV